MWIGEAIARPPSGARLAVAAAWLRTALLSLSALGIGILLDQWILGPVLGSFDWSRPLFMLALIVVAAALAGAVAESLPGRIQAREEAMWRERIVGAALAGRLRPSGRGHPGGGPSGGGHPGGGHLGGGHAGSGHAGGGRPSAGASQHRGAPRPRGASSVEGAALDAATVGVEKTAAYRAGFLAPTLASFTSPLLVLIAWGAGVDLLSALVLAVFVALVPVLIMWAGRRLRTSNHAYRMQEAAASERYVEMIEGLGTLTALGAAGRAREDFAASARRAMRTLSGLLASNQRMIAVNDLLFGFMMTGVAIALLLVRLDAGAITTGQALSGLLLTILLAEPIDRVGRTLYVGLAGRARRDAIARMLPESSDGSESSEASRGPAGSAGSAGAPAADGGGALGGGGASVGGAPPALRLRGIEVELGGRPVLAGIDLDIPAGAHVALVGPTGAGKSTLLRVLSGAQDARGEIRLDGALVGAAQLRRASSVVSQRAGLLSSTIGEDLRLAAPAASDDELRAALDRARFDLAAFPHGLDTPLGDRGAHLSGGQRRRLVIARAQLRPRPLLLLDEATADLDRRTEALVGETLREESAGRTVVQVAHRLDMIARADLVVVLEHGRVTQLGTPAALAAGPGYLREALAAEGAS